MACLMTGRGVKAGGGQCRCEPTRSLETQRLFDLVLAEGDAASKTSEEPAVPALVRIRFRGDSVVCSSVVEARVCTS